MSSVMVQFGGTKVPHTASIEEVGMIQRSQAKYLKEFKGDSMNTTCAATLNLIFQ